MLPADLTAIVYSNLLWFLLTLCLGSVLVTRRPARRPAVTARQPSRCAAAMASPRAGRCRSSVRGHDRVSTRERYDEPAAEGARAAGADFPVGDEGAVPDRARFLADEPPAPLPAAEWPAPAPTARRRVAWTRPLTPLTPVDMPAPASLTSAPPLAWAGSALTPRTRPAPRHARPRPAVRYGALARAAAIVLAVVMVGGAGMGLRAARAGAHAPVANAAGLAATDLAGTAPPGSIRPASPHPQARTRTQAHRTRPAVLSAATPSDRLRAARAELAATLSVIRLLGHDTAADRDGRLLLPSLTRKAGRLQAEIARIRRQSAAAARRTPGPRIRLTAGTRQVPAPSGQAGPRPPVTPVPAGEAGRRAEVVAYARAQLGKPYEWGGAGPYEFDCSGLVMMAWQAVGVSLPHYTVSQWADTYHIARAQLAPGDLIFTNGFGHVQLYAGHGEVIQAPYTGAVVSYAPLPLPAQVDGYASVFPSVHRTVQVSHHRMGGHRLGRRHHKACKCRRRHTARKHHRLRAHRRRAGRHGRGRARHKAR